MLNFTSILPTGRENAISAEQLRERIGAKDDRQVRALVSEARKKGQVICSGNEGYYLHSNDQELREFVDKLEQQAKSILISLKPARKLLKDHGNACKPFEETELYIYFQEVLEDQAIRADEKGKDAAIEEKAEPPRDALKSLRERLKREKAIAQWRTED